MELVVENIDVLFIHPRNFDMTQSFLKLPSLELCQIASVLKQNNYTYKLLDFNITNLEPNETTEILKAYNPKIILIYSVESNHINALKMAKISRNIYKNALIGMNGIIVTFLDEYTLQNKNIDFIIRHDGDYVLKQMLEANCNFNKFTEITNLSYSYKNKIYQNLYEPTKLSDLSVSDRELYDLRHYYNEQTEIILRSSRGCPSNCAFCVKTKFSKFSVFPMQHFFDEIDVLLRYGFKSFFFADDTFAFSMQRLNEFCEYYEKGSYSFKWESNLRLSDVSDELIRKMKEHGAYRVFLGFETVNSKANQLSNKSQNDLDMEHVVSVLKKYNMDFHASFIIGLPGDTKEDLEKTLDFVKKNKPSIVSFNRIKLYPGTDIFDNPSAYGIKYKDKFWFENDNWIKEQMACTEELDYNDIEYYSKKMMMEVVLES